MSGGHNILRSSTGIALATTLSRILGFFREVLTAMVLGGGTVATAWSLAFVLPNLFRRILGEGALGTALVPLISHTLELEGHEAARHKFVSVLFWLSLLLGVITVLVSAGALIAEPFVSTERVKLTLQITPAVMPYCIFICLIGIMASLLNSMRIFFMPALASLLLNIFLIGCLWWVWVCPYFKDNAKGVLYSLSVAVLLSGIVEIVFFLWLLKRADMFPRFNIEAIRDSKHLRELWHLTLPGLIGASVVQISFLIDRGLACWLSDYAVPALTYSDRIVYLPIGIFAVSFGTVSLSEMSRAAAQGDLSRMSSSMVFALRHLLFVSIPIAVFIAIFKEPIIRICFMRGNFDEQAVRETAWALMFYSYGIPAFAAAKVTLAGFYSRKDMKTPVKVSICCVTLSITLSLILMWPLKQGGIALSTVIASFVNNIVLLVLLRRIVGDLHLGPVFRTCVFSAGAALCSGFGLLMLYDKIPCLQLHHYMPKDFLPLGLTGTLFVLSYISLCALARCPEISEICGPLWKKLRSKLTSKGE
ncbi:MAG: murein biosynthesis integral membrane protein MurJ [Lentisphaerae bacterium GWF2_52_8]|nr:MAG: murein biosynthesis integral membrane protein MurJ [Lentisphaerae bacterium GWF2_52_8]